MQENKQEKSLIKQNILLYLAHKGITAYEFYKNSGVTRGVLSQNNGISEENISKFLAYASDVNPTWLVTGQGEMLIDSQVFSTPQIKEDLTFTQLYEDNIRLSEEVGRLKAELKNSREEDALQENNANVADVG